MPRTPALGDWRARSARGLRPSRPWAVVVIVAALLSGACADTEDPPIPAQELLDPTALLDTDPDPDIVEVWLAATTGTVEYLPGKMAHVWAYRDAATEGSLPQVPGPMIEAKVGDLVRVHLRNELPDGTTLHMHGARLPAEMDGAHHAVFPGEGFDHEFVAQDSGAFFYHPHISSEVQIERGLYGPMLLRAGATPRTSAERVLVLDDVKLAADGDLAGEWTEDDIAHGRRGNVLLVNGKPSPTLRAAAGDRQRWHLINASNGRYFHLSIDGYPFVVTGWDTGSLESSYSVDVLSVAPGERFDVLIDLEGPAGQVLDVRTLARDHGGGGGESEKVLFRVALEDRQRADAMPAELEKIERLGTTTDTVARSFVLTGDIHGKYGPQFFINGEFWPFNEPISGALGALETWDVQNDSEHDHPFHLHGMRFQVLSRDGVSEERLGWKDTVDIPAGKSVRFAVRYEAEGRWMYHCQIPEHAERGMMGEIHVEAMP